MALQIRASVVCPEDPGSAPSFHSCLLQKIQHPVLGLASTRYMGQAQTSMLAKTPIYFKKM